MTDIIGLVSGLIPLLILVGIVAAAVWFFTRGSGTGEDPGIGTLKRLYFYGLSFAAMIVAASGAVVLVDYGADRAVSTTIFSQGESQLALGLAMFIVGLPVWLMHWRFAQRALVNIPWEARALARRIYLYLVLGVSATLAGFGLVSLFRVWLGSEPFNGVNLALPLVWGGLWVYHWRVIDSEAWTGRTADPVRRLYVYITSWYGLGMVAVGIGIVLWRALLQAYDSLFATELLISGSRGLWTDTTASGLAVTLVGGLFWWWHWHRAARDGAGSELRQVYLHLFTILPGSAAVLAALTTILFRTLQLGIGQPYSPAADHFRMIPAALAVLAVGIGLWGYHWAVAGQEAQARAAQADSSLGAEALPTARRVYRYLAAATGLVGSGAGIVILVGAAIGLLEFLGEKTLVGGVWRRDAMALAVSLLLVGVPMWAYHWFGIQRAAHGRPGANAESAQELNATSRRIFVYLVFGAAALLVLANLSAVLFMVLRDALVGALGAAVIQDAKWSLAMVLMAGMVSVYHWLVLKEDRDATPKVNRTPTGQSPAPARKVVTAAATEAAGPLIRRIEARLGSPIRIWRRLDSDAGGLDLSDDELDRVTGRITAAPGDRVLLILDASGVTIVPFKE